MAELHPFFVHFPIAILTVAALFDLYAAIKDHIQHTWTAYTLQMMAGISAILAAISGNMAETNIASQESLRLGIAEGFESHISMGNLTVWIIVLVSVGRTFAVLEKKEWALKGWLFPSVSVGVAILVLVTGFLGGELSRDILQFFKNN